MLQVIAKLFPCLTQVRVEQIDLDYAFVHMFITSVFGIDINENQWLIENPEYEINCDELLPEYYDEELEYFMSM